MNKHEQEHSKKDANTSLKGHPKGQGHTAA